MIISNDDQVKSTFIFFRITNINPFYIYSELKWIHDISLFLMQFVFCFYLCCLNSGYGEILSFSFKMFVCLNIHNFIVNECLRDFSFIAQTYLSCVVLYHEHIKQYNNRNVLRNKAKLMLTVNVYVQYNINRISCLLLRYIWDHVEMAGVHVSVWVSWLRCFSCVMFVFLVFSSELS